VAVGVVVLAVFVAHCIFRWWLIDLGDGDVRGTAGCCLCSDSVPMVFSTRVFSFGVGGRFWWIVFWVIEVSVAPAMVLVVACCSGVDFGGDGF
jgi:hypothetical protein